MGALLREGEQRTGETTENIRYVSDKSSTSPRRYPLDLGEEGVLVGERHSARQFIYKDRSGCLQI